MNFKNYLNKISGNLQIADIQILNQDNFMKIYEKN